MSWFVRLSIFLMLVTAPLAVLADSPATGSITGVAPFNMNFNETLVLNDGTTAYNFVFRNSGGTFNGKCAVGGGFSYTDQPCSGSDPTLIDTGGGSTESIMVSRFISAINGTAIGITASANNDGVTIDLVNDANGTAGNVDITETVSNGSFVVTGMSGGSAGGAPVPEFTTYMYMLVLAAGAWYVYNSAYGKVKNAN